MTVASGDRSENAAAGIAFMEGPATCTESSPCDPDRRPIAG